jgi:hypothetical protein
MMLVFFQTMRRKAWMIPKKIQSSKHCRRIIKYPVAHLYFPMQRWKKGDTINDANIFLHKMLSFFFKIKLLFSFFLKLTYMLNTMYQPTMFMLAIFFSRVY